MKVEYSYVYQNKVGDLKKSYERFRRDDELSVEEFKNATVLPLKRFPEDSLLFGRGGILDKDGNYVESSSIAKRIWGKYDINQPEFRKETVVYCGYLVGQWGHFLIEAVSRLWYVLENNPTVDKYIFTIEDGATRELVGNYKEFFDILGITSKIELINKPIQYESIIVPEISFKYGYSYSVHYRNIFDTVIKNVMGKMKDKQSYEKVFLSRSQFKKAQIAEAGLDMLDNYFGKNGYHIIYPERLSLSELIYVLQNAKEVASESGTIPHNILFGYQGQKLVVVERQTVVNPVQNFIDVVRELNVTYIDGHYTIYPVGSGYGPYFLAYNKYFKKFSNDNNYLPPDQCYTDDRYIRKCLRQYMREYKREFYYMWGLEDWAIRYADTIFEAYNESKKELEPYLSGKTIFKFSQLFEIRFVKKEIKKILKL